VETITTSEIELLVTNEVATQSIVLTERELLVTTVQEVIEVEVPQLLVEQIEVNEVLDTTQPFEIVEIAQQGPPGPPGPVGGTTIAGVIDYIWTGQQLDRINLPDGTHKLYTYAAGKILRLDHVKTALTVRKDYVWVGDALESVEVSLL
jgi:hypothetical protein